jgi:hypothetical protein
MTQQSSPGDHVRVGHAEREAVTAILQEAAADGRLDMSELEERLEVALQAKTFGELERLVADLSADLPWRSRPPSAAALVHGPPVPGYSREDPLRLDGGVSTEKRDGVWVVPPFLRISSGAGTVKLNCLQARPAAPVIEIEVVAGAGSVTIVVPDGWAANDDRLGKGMGSKSIKVPREPAPGAPLLVLYGGVGLGSLKVRPPSGRELRKITG